MSALNTLKFVVAKRPQSASPIVQRRNKLSNQLWEQIELARATDAFREDPVRILRVARFAFREGCAAFLLPIWHLRLAISRPRLEK